MKAYRITIGAMSYIAIAPSSCKAIMDALDLHGLRPVVARALRPGTHGGV